MGSPATASSGSTQLLVLLSLVCLHLSSGKSLDGVSAPTPAPAVATAPSPFSFSFDFTNASNYHSEDLRFEGNATVHDQLVDVTCNSFGKNPKFCTGRVSYGHPVPFYDNITGEVASFQTRFTFAIVLDEITRNIKGDGMAFFLACYPSMMSSDSGGGWLGLMSSGDGKRRTAFGNEPFIAVEFDTYNNSFDPDATYDHMSISASTSTL